MHKFKFLVTMALLGLVTLSVRASCRRQHLVNRPNLD